MPDPRSEEFRKFVGDAYDRFHLEEVMGDLGSHGENEKKALRSICANIAFLMGLLDGASGAVMKSGYKPPTL